ncbi:MAG: tyrosine-type recombinase/integrase, partial [Candidatus Rokubacteria bacterium]|nr:tyrosine-type recombinase/integrase [Candidatus Rokubacteria bacterium]
YLRCHGKGRKERLTPLSRRTAARLRRWLHERPAGATDPLFPARHGGALSRDAVARLLTKHTRVAATTCPALHTKPVSPHVLPQRHSSLRLSSSGVAIPDLLGREHKSPEHTA